LYASRRNAQNHLWCEWPLDGERQNLGGTIAAEVEPIENWLELESGLSTLAAAGHTEISAEFGRNLDLAHYQFDSVQCPRGDQEAISVLRLRAIRYNRESGNTVIELNRIPE
jgi:hypothetical protein